MIVYAANEYGYMVQVISDSEIIESYHAGNSRHDDHIIVSPNDPAAIPPNHLMQKAHQVAKAMGIAKNLAFGYDSSLHDELYEYAPKAWRK